MTGVVRGAVVLALLGTLAAGLLGPCVCGPRGTVAREAHACCGPATGLMPRAADCCGPILRAPDAALAGGVHALAALSVAPHSIRLAPAVLVVVPSLTRTPLATSPPPVLRI